MPVPKEHDRRELLLETEQQMLGVMPAVGMMTLVETDDEAGLVTYLRARVEAILVANPWLAGQVNKVDGAFHLTFASTYEADVSGASPYFVFAGQSPLSKDAHYGDVQKHLKQHMLGKVKVGSSETMYRVTLVKLAEARTYGIVMTMYHPIGDGCAFFQLQSSLSQDHPVVALSPTREAFFDEEKLGTAHLSKAKATWFSSARPFLGTVSKSIALAVASLWSSPRRDVSGGMWALDMDEVARRKGAAKGRVSTNDVVTSWWFRQCSETDDDNASRLGKGSGRVMNMVVNLRNRVKKVDNSYAGNYLSTFVFAEGDDVTPDGIRHTLAAFGDAPAEADEAQDEQKLPSVWRSLGEPWNIITNWTGFFTALSFPNATTLSQFPLLPFGETLGVVNCCVIYRSTPDQLAVFAAKSAMNSQRKIDDNDALFAKKLVALR